MTTMEVISQLNSLIDDRKSFIDDNGQGDDIYLNDIAALTAAIEAISTLSEASCTRRLMLSGLCSVW